MKSVHGAALLLVVLTTLVGCGSVSTADLGYRPLIMEQGVDLPRYEREREACEAQSQRTPSNYPPTELMRFRQCLLDKGYRLLS